MSVIQLFKPKPKMFWERMTYTELLNEQRYLISEIKKVRRVFNAATKIDPRCALTPEVNKLCKEIDEFEKGYKFILEKIQGEMIRRMRDGK